MPFLTSFKSLDWPTLFVELIIVFVGITAALWFDNWNQYRMDRGTEPQILTELAISLEADVGNADRAIAGNAIEIASIDAVLMYVEGGMPLDSALVPHFTALMVLFYFAPDRSVYAYLATVGLSIVQNDSLRWRIARLYEKRAPWLQRETDTAIKDLTEFVYPVLRDRFTEYFPAGYLPEYSTVYPPPVPHSFDQLRHDKEFLTVVRSWRNQLGWVRKLHMGTRRDLASVLADTRQELEET